MPDRPKCSRVCARGAWASRGTRCEYRAEAIEQRQLFLIIKAEIKAVIWPKSYNQRNMLFQSNLFETKLGFIH
jgi:hypothetical protein